MNTKTTIATDEILTVHRVIRDGDGTLCVTCPHCNTIIGIEGDDMDEIRGEQYQHKRREYPGPHGTRSTGCDGWLEVSHDAKAVRA